MATLPVMGCDPHLDLIAVSIIDPVGAEMVGFEVPNRADGWERVIDAAARHGVATVGIEGASGLGHRLSETVTKCGLRVVEVPTRVTARTRRVDGAGKTDPGDARTIARAAAADVGHPWTSDPQLETIRVICSRREHLVSAQTADINQLRALLADIDPARAATTGRLRTTRSLQPFTSIVDDYPAGYPHTVAQLIADIATECLRRLETIRNLTRQLEQLMPPAGRNLIEHIDGCGVIVAAQLLSQLAGTGGFTTDAKLAAWAGTAPLDASSGRHQRHRLNRGGNRQANRAIHTIVITQHRHHGEAHTYITRRITEGKTRKEAIRAAKRHITRRIWKTLQLT